jgi:adenine-specific DNA-methyltransferase
VNRERQKLHARRLRQDSTDAERKLWGRLRDRQLDGHKFRRQRPVGRFIVDFLCLEGRLVVEIDGGQHADNVDADERRTHEIEGAGYRVIRFWNHEVLSNIEGVLTAISQALA